MEMRSSFFRYNASCSRARPITATCSGVQTSRVNRLEEKAKTAHRLENNKAEQSELDELAGQRRLQPFALSL